MKNEVNLLPSNSNNLLQVKRGLMFWSVIWVIAIGGLIWGSQHQSQLAAQSENEVRGLEQKLVPVKHVGSQIGGLKRQLEQIHMNQQLSRELATHQPTLTLLGNISAAASQSDVCVTHLVLSPLDQRSSSTDSDSSSFKLSLKGVALNNISIAGFASYLRQSRCFDQVQLKSTLNEQMANGLAKRYEIECTF